MKPLVLLMVLKCSIADMINDQTLQSTLLKSFHFPEMDVRKNFQYALLNVFDVLSYEYVAKNQPKRLRGK